MNSLIRSISSSTSTSKVDTFEEKNFSLIKNSRNYGNQFLSLIQQEDRAQTSSSLAKKVK